MKVINYLWYPGTRFSCAVTFGLLSPLLLILLPLSLLFCLVATVRRWCYLLNCKKSQRQETPVVVVGNIVVGGSGKTPLLIALCEYLKSKGYQPGVVSRGYGGSFQGVHQLTADDSAQQAGDEPLMIYQHCQVPVVVSADRPAAVERLLADNDCDIVLSDDGLQHYRMGRDYEIAVIDSARGLGNHLCLPAGPLRESPSRLGSVDLVVYNGEGVNTSSDVFYRLEPAGLIPLASMIMNHEGLIESPLMSIDDISASTVHAVAGIGNPDRFFSQLRQQGLGIIEHPFADHHHYSVSDFSGWASACIIMTEKDAVKCIALMQASDDRKFLQNALVYRVRAEFSAELTRLLDERLLPLLIKQPPLK